MLCLGILISFSMHSQSNKIDSLLSIAEKSEGIDSYDHLVDLIIEVNKTDILKTLQYAYRASEVAYQFGDSAKIVNSLRIIGSLFNQLSRTKEAEQILLKALPIAKRNNLKREYCSILNNLGLAYTYEAEYIKALNLHFECLKLREESGDLSGVSTSLLNIGVAYYKMKHYEKALEFHVRSLELKRKHNDNHYFVGLLINTGLCYTYLGKFTTAHEYFFSAFDHCGPNCENRDIINGEFGLGVSFYGLGNFSEALNHFNRSLQISRDTGEQRFIAENLVYMARIFFKLKNQREAIKALKDCEKIALEFGYNELLITTYQELSNFFLTQNNYEEASHYQNKYINIRDSVYNEELTINLLRRTKCLCFGKL